MLNLLLAFGLSLAADPAVIEESRLEIGEETLIRLRRQDNELEYGLKLEQADGREEWLIAFGEASGLETRRERPQGLMHEPLDLVYEIRDGEAQLVGHSYRRFHAGCFSFAETKFPTPLSESAWIGAETSICGKTKSSFVEVVDREQSSDLFCELFFGLCVWKPQAEIVKRSQLHAFASVWWWEWLRRALRLRPFMNPVKIESMGLSGDRSFYEADLRTMFLGGGKAQDAEDAFIVLHEWAHAITDDLNPGLIGYESLALHEGLSDFFASHVLDDACFAPYDAIDKGEDLECSRDLSEARVFPEDFRGLSPQEDGLVLASALWELSLKLDEPESLLASIFEAIMRLPKRAEIYDFWPALTESAKRQGVYNSAFDDAGMKRGLIR